MKLRKVIFTTELNEKLEVNIMTDFTSEDFTTDQGVLNFYNLSELLNLYPMINTNTTFLCNGNEGKELLLSFGWTKTIDISNYIGRTFGLKNGNYFTISDDNSSIKYYKSDGTQIVSSSIVKDGGQSLFAPYIIDNKSTAAFQLGILYYKSYTAFRLSYPSKNYYPYYRLANGNLLSFYEGAYEDELKDITAVNLTFAHYPSIGLPNITQVTGQGDYGEGEPITISLSNISWEPNDGVVQEYKEYTFQCEVDITDDGYKFTQSTTVNPTTINPTSTVVSSNFVFGTATKGLVTIVFKTNSTVDPYVPGGISDGMVGGDGTFVVDNTSIGLTSVPDKTNIGGSIFGRAMITIYTPTISQFDTFTAYLWSSQIWQDVSNLMNGYPTDIVSQALISHHILPFRIIETVPRQVKIGWLQPEGVTMNTAPNEETRIAFDNIQINEFWGGYMDYYPYTKIQLYLPYVGMVPIDTDKVMTGEINIGYEISIATGDFVCTVLVRHSKNYGSKYATSSNSWFIYNQYAGNCAFKVPLTGLKNTTMEVMTKGMISTVTGAISGAVGGGLSGGPVGAVVGGALGALGGAASTAENMIGQKQFTEIMSQLDSNTGFYARSKPYFLITRPRQLVPNQQHKYTGYPSFTTLKLSNCVGFTQVESINMLQVHCTENEYDEIMALLKQGVII